MYFGDVHCSSKLTRHEVSRWNVQYEKIHRVGQDFTNRVRVSFPRGSSGPQVGALEVHILVPTRQVPAASWGGKEIAQSRLRESEKDRSWSQISWIKSRKTGLDFTFPHEQHERVRIPRDSLITMQYGHDCRGRLCPERY